MELQNSEIQDFQNRILELYHEQGRQMPWREDTSPYSIFLSELMLQQTQVARVKEYYEKFLKLYPDFRSLAEAPLPELLSNWKGLGYNRRAKFMREAARMLCRDYAGRLPADPDELRKLPGIGPNTAGSISAFAFNLPVVFIETNIRRVMIHEFFQEQDGGAAGPPGNTYGLKEPASGFAESHPGSDNKVHDREIMPVIEQTLFRENPRVWYWALMDFGVELKRKQGNANRRSAHYTRQSPFEGSLRQLRSGILHFLNENGPTLQEGIISHVSTHLGTYGHGRERIESSLRELEREGFIICEDHDGGYRIAD
ncbi:A/G-specific adenine glycosylase [Salinispira pacifica]|uniref:Adenine DNA glycosylase n=1 Tax=Salinispira pacifica TaxID=1307761 RepID=V5WJK7_9SPIO|nr:A/G-specific adenine glycosylase [Salinispira pacifica]AHC15351.1 A/G-specific adenine glycosylase [Salinispira pacifica]